MFGFTDRMEDPNDFEERRKTERQLMNAAIDEAHREYDGKTVRVTFGLRTACTNLQHRVLTGKVFWISDDDMSKMCGIDYCECWLQDTERGFSCLLWRVDSVNADGSVSVARSPGMIRIEVL
ncbi:hypothetical protein [Bifidobacterium sp. SO1]|uniref:hypothetical protein n=1 Tax=Bifidobacterium sp. SO1 TaxID=2809029 RepID=UPI001BDC879B|nr:hypothetical protein [Bifidobacterium sp. SO1]MBT1162130.1 hypothetical protein [Bifidobacterium sp. SO1]